MHQKLTAGGVSNFDASSLRYNIGISAPGADGFWEDFATKLVAMDQSGVELVFAGPSSRCRIPTINQQTAIVNPKVNRILNKFRYFEEGQLVDTRPAPENQIYVAQNTHHNDRTIRLEVGQRFQIVW